MMEAAPGTALEMARAELLLEFLEVALAAPAQLGNLNQLLKRMAVEARRRYCARAGHRTRITSDFLIGAHALSAALVAGISRGSWCRIRRLDGG
jgi:hypothetical protein